MTLYPGSQYTLTAVATDATGAVADPLTLTLTKRPPFGSDVVVLIGALTHVSTGVYTYTTSESAAGAYVWEAKSTGAVVQRAITRVKIEAGLT